MEDGVNTKRRKSFRRIFKHKLYRMRNIFCLICLLLSGITCFMIFRTDLFSFMYPFILFLILFIFTFIGFIFINVHNKNILKGIGYFLLSIISILSIGLLFYVNTIHKFFDNNFNENSHIYLENTYYVLGKSDLKYNDDMLKGNIGVFDKTYNLDNVFSRVHDQYSFDLVEYHDVTKIFEDFNNNTISFVLMDKSLYDLYFLLSQDYKNDYSILDTFQVYTKKNKTNGINKDKYNIYVKVLSDEGFNDLNIIVSVNHNKNNVLFTYIPEDSYLSIFNEHDKLEYLNMYGTDITKSTIEDLLDIDIDYYFSIHENKLSSFIDYLGGIKYCSDESFEVSSLSIDSLKINDGCNRIDGEESILLSQYEEDRLEHNIILALSIMDEIFDIKTLKRFNETLNSFGNVIDTDLNKELVASIIQSSYRHKEWSIEKQSVDGVVSTEKVSLSSLEDDVILLDSNSVSEASLKIQDTLK